MRAMPIIALAASFGLAFILLGGAGVFDMIGDPGSGGLSGHVADEAEDEEAMLDPEEGGDEGMMSFVFSAIGELRSLFSAVFLLPNTLQNIGIPFAVSYPIGLGMQLVALIGLIQIALRWEIQ